MIKNTASQKWSVFAFSLTDNTAVTGDSAQITGKIAKDGAAGVALGDANPTEQENGYYVFDLTQAETNADYLQIFPESSTANVQVIGVPGAVWTTAALTTSGYVQADVLAISGSTDAADNLEASAETIVVAAAAAGTLSTTQMTTTLTEATDDHYNGRIIIWTSGDLQNQATNITDYTGATKMLTFTAVTEAPGAGDTFVIV